MTLLFLVCCCKVLENCCKSVSGYTGDHYCSLFYFSRREAICLRLGRLRQKIRPLRRVGPPSQNSHGGKEIQLSALRPQVHAKRPPVEARQETPSQQENTSMETRGGEAETAPSSTDGLKIHLLLRQPLIVKWDSCSLIVLRILHLPIRIIAMYPYITCTFTNTSSDIVYVPPFLDSFLGL